MAIPEHSTGPAKARERFAPLRTGRQRLAVAAALVGAFAVGGGVTAVALQSRQPALVMLTPAPIAAMQDWNAVAVKGQVADIFGNKFILQDESGRALVETGPRGEGGTLVAKSETVTVQGRFEHGFIHAQVVSHGDGRNDIVGPPGPPHGGLFGGPRGGPLALRGPAGGPNAPEAR